MTRVPVVSLLAVVLPFAVPWPAGHEPEHGRSVRELFVPGSWTGQWEVLFEYRGESGALVETEEITEALCSGDRLGLSAYVGRGHGHERHDGAPDGGARRADCVGFAEDSVLGVACSVRFTHGDCRVDFRVDSRRSDNPTLSAGPASGGSSASPGTAARP